jgi:hypothetical protein
MIASAILSYKMLSSHTPLGLIVKFSTGSPFRFPLERQRPLLVPAARERVPLLRSWSVGTTNHQAQSRWTAEKSLTSTSDTFAPRFVLCSKNQSCLVGQCSKMLPMVFWARSTKMRLLRKSFSWCKMLARTHMLMNLSNSSPSSISLRLANALECFQEVKSLPNL